MDSIARILALSASGGNGGTAGAVSSVNNKIGAVDLCAEDIKTVSNQTIQAELDAKQSSLIAGENINIDPNTNTISTTSSNLVTSVNLKTGSVVLDTTDILDLQGVTLENTLSMMLEKMDIKSNQSGQVKVRYENLSTIGFSANVETILSIRNATAIVQDAPTTMWPQEALDTLTDAYETGFFIQGTTEAEDRIRENNVLGQVHRWRVAGQWTNKNISNQGILRCFLVNPDTGFAVSNTYFLLSGITDDSFTFEFTSISDSGSLDSGRGYQLGFETSFDDPNLTIQVNSIVRISEAMEVK